MFLPSGPFLVPAGASFVENGVIVDGNDYLTGSTAYASNIRSALFFASFVSGHNSSRHCLSSWDTTSSTSNIFHADFNGSSATDVTIRVRISDSLGNDIILSHPLAGTQTARFHVLVSVYNDGTGLYGVLSAWDSVSSTWTSTSSSDTSTGSVGYLSVNLATTPRLFRAVDGSSHSFNGTSYRNAAWFATGGNEIAATTTTATRENFVAGGAGTAIEDPATAQTAYGTPIYDFNGPAADYNVPTHDGSHTYTKTGTFA